MKSNLYLISIGVIGTGGVEGVMIHEAKFRQAVIFLVGVGTFVNSQPIVIVSATDRLKKSVDCLNPAVYVGCKMNFHYINTTFSRIKVQCSYLNSNPKTVRVTANWIFITPRKRPSFFNPVKSSPERLKQ